VGTDKLSVKFHVLGTK